LIPGFGLYTLKGDWEINMITKIDLERPIQSFYILQAIKNKLNETTYQLSDENRIWLLNSFDIFKLGFDDFDLGVIKEQYEIFQIAIQNREKLLALNALDRIDYILVHELKSIICFILPKDSNRYINCEIDPIIHNSFPDLFDFKEANKCFAFGCNTACVYHCNRTLELVLPKIAKLLKKITPKYDAKKSFNDNWGTILNSIDAEVRRLTQLPNKSRDRNAKLSKISELSLTMRNINDAWRKNAVHAHGEFSRLQATEILNFTSWFLKYIAEIEQTNKQKTKTNNNSQ
jgi:hypothetical protein